MPARPVSRAGLTVAAMLPLVLVATGSVAAAPVPGPGRAASTAGYTASPLPPTDTPDTLLDGVASVPKHDVARAKQRQRSAVSAMAADDPVLVTGYRTAGHQLRPLPMAQRNVGAREALVPIGGDGLVDAQGVRMFRIAGDARLWDHPVAQAQYAMRNLESYRRTGNAVYLNRAAANAQRLIDRRVESRGAWFYPYDFDFAVHGIVAETLPAPWYSAMAQGQALSTFVRLYEHTSAQRWRDAADMTFLSLRLAPVEGQPPASWVSAEGDLWLEEYPRWPITNSERVLNGHLFAADGLFEYALLTGDPAAAELFDAALTTVRRYVLDGFRMPSWASAYCLRHRTPSLNYHKVHIGQMLMAYSQTGVPWFAVTANTLRHDFALVTTAGQAQLTPRSTVAYQLDSARKIIRSRTVKFTRTTGAPVDRRERTAGGGPIMLRVSSGAFTNWWFPEGVGKAWVQGAVEVHDYNPQLTVVFGPGTYSAYRLDAAGKIVGSKTVTISRDSSAPVPRSAIVAARPSYYLAVGAFAGYWVPMNSKIVISGLS
jgi:hypothetical protein